MHYFVRNVKSKAGMLDSAIYTNNDIKWRLYPLDGQSAFLKIVPARKQVAL